MQSQSPIRHYKLDEKDDMQYFFDIENDIVEFMSAMIELDDLYSINSAQIFGQMTHLISRSYITVSTSNETKFGIKMTGEIYQSFTPLQGMPTWIGAGSEMIENQKMFVLSFAKLDDAKEAIKILSQVKICVYLSHDLGEYCIHHNPTTYRYEIRIDEYGQRKMEIEKKYFDGFMEYDSFKLFNTQSNSHLSSYKKIVVDKYPIDNNDIREKAIIDTLANPFMSHYDKLIAIEAIAWKMLSLGDPQYRVYPPEVDLPPATYFTVRTMTFNFKMRLDSLYAKNNIDEVSHQIDLQFRPPELPFHPYANEITEQNTANCMLSLFDQKLNQSPQVDKYYKSPETNNFTPY